MCILKISSGNLLNWGLVRVFFFEWQALDAAPHAGGCTPANAADDISYNQQSLARQNMYTR